MIHRGTWHKGWYLQASVASETVVEGRLASKGALVAAPQVPGKLDSPLLVGTTQEIQGREREKKMSAPKASLEDIPNIF